MTRKLFPIVVAVAISFATSAFASHCRNTGSFDKWLEAFKKDAIAQGISPRVITEASPSMTFSALGFCWSGYHFNISVTKISLHQRIDGRRCRTMLE